MEFSLSKKLLSSKTQNTSVGSYKTKHLKKIKELDGKLNREEHDDGNDGVNINFLFLFVFLFSLLGLLTYSSFNLQILQGESLLARSQNNQISVQTITPRRGIIFDRNGVKVAENTASIDCYLDIKPYLDAKGIVEDVKLEESVKKLESLLGDSWYKDFNDEGVAYTSISEKIYSLLDKEPTLSSVLIATGLDNQKAIDLKTIGNEIPGLRIEEGSIRTYPYKDYMTPILGYTGIVMKEDFDSLDYIGLNDTVGRTGVERWYDKDLFGKKGKVAKEVNALGEEMSNKEILIEDAVPGKSLYLTIDVESQMQSYEILKKGVKTYNASSGTMIIEDISNGEIISMASFPSYDNNLFIKGLSQKEFENILYQKGTPFTNKAIASQAPPGSIFKTVVASSALDAGVINRNTVYVSRYGYSFSNGAPFQEYNNNVYGPLTVVDALMLSSNIFFCETIRHWDINKLVPYLENFGIGQATGIDIPGEAPGRLPSPENKVLLANTTSPWLEPYWYPEGDSCNSVIGQGITTVTPIQAVNWISAIANGGTLQTPHVGKKFLTADGKEEDIPVNIIRDKFVSTDALSIVKEGMRASVAGSRRVIIPLTDAKVQVAAKTGTAEFGKLNKDGRYEHTHAWVVGFFPYDKPKYAFVVFLEDGGASNNSAQLAREFIDWFVVNKKI